MIAGFFTAEVRDALGSQNAVSARAWRWLDRFETEVLGDTHPRHGPIDSTSSGIMHCDGSKNVFLLEATLIQIDQRNPL